MFEVCKKSHFRHSGGVIAAVLLIFTAINGQPDKLAKSFAEIAKKVEPAVVSIDTKSRVSQPVARATPSPGTDDDVMEFLRRQMQQRPVYGVGSGFIVDKRGYILTNAHVVQSAARITVKIDSGEEFAATVLGSDDETDIAVLKIDARRDLPSLQFGDSEKAEVGDWVLAIGSPFGLAKSVTAGIISQKQRETPYSTSFQRFIQTDAAVNRGNSGGPLVNLDGDVVGVNSQIATSTGDYNGVSFALPSREAEYVYNQILKNGKVRRGYLGVLLDSVKAEYAAVYGLKSAAGAIITDIRDAKGPAATAGMQSGDVITEINGQPVQNAFDLISKVAATLPDLTITVGYLREVGAKMEQKTATIKLGERPVNRVADDTDDRRPLPVDGAKPEQKPFGLTLVEFTPVLAATAKLEGQKGVLIKEINPVSFIADVKNSSGNIALGEGDLIQKINRVAVTDVKAFTDIVAKLKVGDAVVLHVLNYNPATGGPQLKIVQFTVR
ncbi:MAG: trypsin-like peptidase domain-containing protein [Pyrinomonadaceae bacterium]